jgi:hypothetical protein
MQLATTIEIYAGGPGSGCRGSNCGRKPEWWNEPSDNPFARGMTKGQELQDWFDRHEVAKEGDKYVLYHATPAKGGATDSIRKGSYLAEDAATAKQQASRDRGPKAGKMNVIKVLVNPEDIRPGVWATLRNDYRVK